MITPIQVASGLGGAIGSAYDPARNRLYFTEFDGKLSRLDLTPARGRLFRSSNSQTIRGTFSFDFDAGVEGDTSSGRDVFWEQETAIERQMRPLSGAAIAFLGPVSYNGLSAAELASLTYTTDPINADDNATNLLAPGAVFAVRTTAGNYAKVQVITYDYNIVIRYRTYRIPNPYQVIGTGYDRPEDIALSEDGVHAYVTERGGNFLRVDLNNANRAAATVVAGGMTIPHQIALDELRGFAYVPEFASPARLQRIDLNTGAQFTVVGDLDRAIGLVMTADARYAYVSEQAAGGGRIRRVDLQSGSKTEMVGGLSSPFYLEWSDAGESGLLFTERDPANRVSLLDLSEATPVVRHIADVPSRPSSVVVANPFRLYVCSDSIISRLDTETSVFTPAGPVILGIGHVPADRIIAGYADTTADPGYFYQVKDAPFGGTLPIMLNHTRAYADGARYYKLAVNGDEPRQSFTDYKWSSSNNRFNAETVNPTGSGYYRVRRPGELWYNHWLGYRLNTAGLPNGLHTITVRLFQNANAASLQGSFNLTVRIDNTLPEAVIEEILHVQPGGALVPVGTCGIVDEGTDQFRFRITARDSEGHLRNWRLSALWGDNGSGKVAEDAYVPNPSRSWTGVNAGLIPGIWTATSRRCAHTFVLSVWDRTINGYGYLHRRGYHKSITLALDS